MSAWLRCAVVAAGLIGCAAEPRACALEEDVSLSRDTLNHYYPDALDVLSRVVQARRTGVLTKAAELPPPMHLQRAMATVLRFDRKVRGLVRETKTEPFALLQIETMLWSRFPALPVPGLTGAAPVEAHAKGPESGDLVVVAGEDVLREVVAGRMTLGDAREKGWLRLYGSDGQAARFMATFGAPSVGTPPSAGGGPSH